MAALEQHGRHMPVFTDSMLMGEIARRAEVELGKDVLFAPLQWLGLAPPHGIPGDDVGGAPGVSGFAVRMLENFISHGFKRLIILNGQWRE